MYGEREPATDDGEGFEVNRVGRIDGREEKYLLLLYQALNPLNEDAKAMGLVYLSLHGGSK